MKRINNVIRKFESLTVAIGLLGITALIFLNVLLRYIFKNSFTWAEELSRYLLVWITFIGGSLAVRDNVHVNMDLLLNNINIKLKKPLIYLIYLGSSLIMVYLSYSGFKIMNDVRVSGQVSTSMEFLPIWLVYLAVPIGSILMAMNYFYLFYLNLKSKSIIRTIEEEIK